MLMKKRLLPLSLLALLLVIVLALSSCTVSFSSVFRNAPAADGPEVYESMEKTTAVGADWNIVQVRGDYAVMYESPKSWTSPGTIHIYDYVSDKLIFTEKEPESKLESVDALSVELIDFDMYIVNKISNGISTGVLYTLDGKALLNASTLITTDYAGHVFAEGKIYEQKKGKISETKQTYDVSMTTDELNCQKVNGYGVDIKESYVALYNENGIQIAYFAFPSDAVGSICRVLNDGSLFIQYLIPVPTAESALPDEKTYDIMQDGKYYTLSTVVLSPKGSEKSIKADFVLTDVYTADELNTDEGTAVKASVDNIAVVRKIVDKKIDMSASSDEYAVLDNNGSIKYIDKILPGQMGLPRQLSSGYLLVTTRSGRRYLCKSSGSVIGDVTGSTVTSRYVISSTGIFDFSGKCLLNLEKEEKTVAFACDNYILLYGKAEDGKQPDGFLYDGKNITQVTTGSTQTIISATDEFFAVRKDNTGILTIKNAKGEDLCTTASEPTQKAVFDSGILLTADGFVYKLSK